MGSMSIRSIFASSSGPMGTHTRIRKESHYAARTQSIAVLDSIDWVSVLRARNSSARVKTRQNSGLDEQPAEADEVEETINDDA